MSRVVLGSLEKQQAFQGNASHLLSVRVEVLLFVLHSAPANDTSCRASATSEGIGVLHSSVLQEPGAGASGLNVQTGSAALPNQVRTVTFPVVAAPRLQTR
jgi:hypothetical protein